MQKRKLGREGLEVSAIGLGCMGMSFAYGGVDEATGIEVLHRALDLGVTMWDSAEMYGPFKNEELLGRALKGRRRESVILATKFAYRYNEKGEMVGLDGSAAHVKRTIEGSLKRFGTDYIDLYYQHRLDPNTPIEETVGAMVELVKAGKVRYIGLSEVGPGTIRRAHAVYPLSAVQTEYSLWERGIESEILPTLRELGIGLVAYSPVGRGFLSGKVTTVDAFGASDSRRRHPRFMGENFTHNMKIVEDVRRIAAKHEVTPAQVALAWLLRQGEDIVPIPGTRHVSYLEENVAATTVQLPASAWSDLDRALASFQVAGLRYPEASMRTIDTTR